MCSLLFGTKPISEAMLAYCHLDPEKHISVVFPSNFSLTKMRFKMSSGKWQTFCLRQCVNALTSEQISFDLNLTVCSFMCLIDTKSVLVLTMLFCRTHDVIKWKYFLCYWPFLRGIDQSPMNSPHKGQWRGASVFSFICAWINGWVNNHDAGASRRHRAHYDVIVMQRKATTWSNDHPVDWCLRQATMS